MAYGTPEFQALFKVMRADGNIHPSELTRPALRNEDRRYYDAFRSLSASRNRDQGEPLPIPVSEVKSYMEIAGIEDPDTRLKYLRLIQGLDAVEMKAIRAQQK